MFWILDPISGAALFKSAWFWFLIVSQGRSIALYHDQRTTEKLSSGYQMEMGRTHTHTHGHRIMGRLSRILPW